MSEDRSVVSIHLVIQSTCVTQIVSCWTKLNPKHKAKFLILPLLSLLQSGVLLDPQLTHCLFSRRVYPWLTSSNDEEDTGDGDNEEDGDGG